MSRVANSPVELPKGVEVKLGGEEISVKGSKGTLAMPINPQVEINRKTMFRRLPPAVEISLRALCPVPQEHWSTIW